MIIGLDVGGTNIDIVAIENNKVVDFNKFQISSDIVDSILYSLEKFLLTKDINEIEKVVLSTTLTTNAIVQKRLDKVGMIIEHGIGAKPDDLMCGDINVFLDGYINNRGIIVKDFDKAIVDYAIKNFKINNINSVGIVSKFSTRNPQHELQVYQAIKNANFQFVSLGHRMSGKLNFVRRVYTTYLNSAVFSDFDRLLKTITTFLNENNIPVEKVYFQKPDGGITNISLIKDFPIMSILSGPAASAQGAYILANTDLDSITIDIGGTTTDISFISNNQFVLELYGAKIDDYPTLVRSIFSKSIGLGSESIIDYRRGFCTIGPETKKVEHDDKDILTFGTVLEYLNDSRNFLLRSKIENYSRTFGISVERLCQLVICQAISMIDNAIKQSIEYINNTPVYTINKLIYREKFMPKCIILVGGPAKLLKPHLEKGLAYKIILPDYYLVANAIGCALGSISKEYNLVADTDQGIISIPELGVFQNISSDLGIDKAKELLTDLIIRTENGLSKEDIEIVEESLFNMVRNYRFCGQIIKLKAQLKPRVQKLL